MEDDKIYFITGNKNKFLEAKDIIPELEQLELDLEEIQETNSQKIIESKMKEALKHGKSSFVIEDTSLYMDCLNGLPGPLIKWFLEKIGNEGLYELSVKLGNNKAEAKTLIGYAKKAEELLFFEGSLKGEIVKPTGKTGFGWDFIFKPNNYNKTFQEMTREEKSKMSMRKIAFEKLREYLKTKHT